MYNDFVSNSLYSIFVLIFIAAIGLISFYGIYKYNDSDRKKKQLRNRILYLCFLVYIFALAKIWVEGFTQLVAVLGLVSAALVITNKESIMSLVGWLIINWRELFTEGDLVRIDKNKGYIKSIGILYITMEETAEHSFFLKTGKILKIPNNNIILHPTTNFTYDFLPILQKHELLFKTDTDLVLLKSKLQDIIKEVIKEANDNNLKASLASARKSKKHKMLDENKHQICFSLKNDDEMLVEVIVYFYCYLAEYESAKLSFITKLLDFINNSEKVNLAE